MGRDTNGRVVFAPYAAPGDEALVAITQQHKSFARGQLLQLLHASPLRVAPPCPFYRPPLDERSHTVSPAWQPLQSCGGCQIQHLSYAAQLQAKRSIVVQALQRIGGVDAAEEIVSECVPSPQPFHYRNKAEFVIAPDDGDGSSASVAPGWRAGFLAPESHHAVDITHCPIQQDKNNTFLAALREALRAGLASPFDERRSAGVVKRVTVRTSSQGESLAVAETTDAAWPEQQEFAAALLHSLPHLTGVLRRSTAGSRTTMKTLGGRDWLEEEICGLRLRVTGDSFFQINTALTPTLVETALRLAQLQPGHRVLDLFCGVGLFTLAAAQCSATVSGIEANEAAVVTARDNAQRNGLKATFHAGDAARSMQRGPWASTQWDVVLLDPPRAGAATCIAPLLRLQPQRIVYVSCDPATLARDLKQLCKGGYALRAAVPLDMFPQTAHVETVAQLERVN